MTTLTDPFFLNTVLWARTGEDQTVSFMDLQSASVHEIRTKKYRIRVQIHQLGRAAIILPPARRTGFPRGPSTMNADQKQAVLNTLNEYRRDVEVRAKYQARNHTERAKLNAKVKRIRAHIRLVEDWDV